MLCNNTNNAVFTVQFTHSNIYYQRPVHEPRPTPVAAHQENTLELEWSPIPSYLTVPGWDREDVPTPHMWKAKRPSCCLTFFWPPWTASVSEHSFLEKRNNANQTIGYIHFQTYVRSSPFLTVRISRRCGAFLCANTNKHVLCPLDQRDCGLQMQQDVKNVIRIKVTVYRGFWIEFTRTGDAEYTIKVWNVIHSSLSSLFAIHADVTATTP